MKRITLNQSLRKKMKRATSKRTREGFFSRVSREISSSFNKIIGASRLSGNLSERVERLEKSLL